MVVRGIGCGMAAPPVALLSAQAAQFARGCAGCQSRTGNAADRLASIGAPDATEFRFAR
jgi:hypothetical protein